MAIWAALFPVINKVLDFIPDPKQRAEAMESLMTNLQQWDAQQNAVNVEEAKSTNLFVAGWRPAIGWVCAIALFYTYILTPFATWGFAIAEVEVPPMPKLDNNLWELLFGMLGMGGLRTLEKIKGVAR